MGYTYYEPLNVWLDPASIPDVVAHIQEYLTEYPLINQSDIEQIVVDYITAHPELVGGVDSVNGKTGEVVLTASDINTTGTTTIQSVLTALNSQISEIVQTITGLDTRVTTNATGITNEATARANADTALGNRITALQGAVGSPLVAATAAAMTDTTKIYVYTGSESGYTNGNWYYYNGSAWVSGGVYNATAINTDTTLTVAGMAADAKATGDGLNTLKSAVDKILLIDSFTLTGSTSRVYEYTFTVGRTYLVTNKKSGTSPQLRTCDSSGTLIEWIKNGLAYGETVEFKPTLPASYFRMYYASSNCEIEIATSGDALNTFNDGINDAVFDSNLDVGTDATGYYTGNVGEQIAYTEQATSHSFTIDLSNYVNRTVRVKLNSGSTGSTRICALCNSSGLINQRYTESEVMKGVSFYPNAANHNLYISYSTSGSGLSCYVLSTINESFQGVYDVTGKIAYVDSFVSSEGDGSPNNPFKEIATAINSGYGVIYANAGNYQPVEAFNIGTVSIKLWNRTLDSNGKLQKIVITAVDRKSGIWCDNCNSVTVEDVEFNAPSRYGLYITNCKSASVTRCIAYNNTTASFSLFRVDNSNAVFRDCVAYGATLDGFNIHTAGDTQFINCKAYNCGDDGISHHEACTGAIIGGEYYGNGKGGISPFSGCEVNIYDVYSHDNAQYGIYCASTASLNVTKVIMANCALKNNTVADVYVSYGEAVGFNNIYDTKSVSNGTFTEVVKA